MRIGSVLGSLPRVVAMALAIAAPARAAGPATVADPVAARLVAEAGSIAPGQTLWLGLHLDIAPGWHVYWRNPGDSGLPTEIAWTLPAGFAAGDIAWPVPQRFVVGTIGNYGYAGSADLLVPITAPSSLTTSVTPGVTAASPVRLEAHASWLVCSDICIPGEAKLALDLPVAATPAPPVPAVAALFEAARNRLPQTAGFATRVAVSPRELRLSIPQAALAGIDRPTASFFPFEANIVDAAAEPREEPRADGLDLVLSRASGPAATLPTGPTAASPATLDGVLALRGADGTERAYAISASLVSAPQAARPPPLQGDAAVGWWQALLLAFWAA